jgi:hypothetical protein
MPTQCAALGHDWLYAEPTDPKEIEMAKTIPESRHECADCGEVRWIG